MWNGLKDGLLLGSYITDLISGQGHTQGHNMTTAQFMDKVGLFLGDIKVAFEDLSPEVKHMLDAFSNVDWMKFYDTLIQATEGNET